MLFKDIDTGQAQLKPRYDKFIMACKFAAANGHDYIWIDTRCIDKSSSAELSEAINSMFRGYQESAECFPYLCDVPTQSPWDSVWLHVGGPYKK